MGMASYFSLPQPLLLLLLLLLLLFEFPPPPSLCLRRAPASAAAPGSVSTSPAVPSITSFPALKNASPSIIDSRLPSHQIVRGCWICGTEKLLTVTQTAEDFFLTDISQAKILQVLKKAVSFSFVHQTASLTLQI